MNRQQKRAMNQQRYYTAADLKEAREEGIAEGVNSATCMMIAVMAISLNLVDGYGAKRILKIVNHMTGQLKNIDTEEKKQSIMNQVKKQFGIRFD